MKIHLIKSLLILLGLALSISCATNKFSSDAEVDSYFNKEVTDIENKFGLYLNKDIDSLTIEEFVSSNYAYPGMGIRNEYVYGNKKLRKLFKNGGYSNPEMISVFLLKSYYQRKKTANPIKFKEVLKL